jgi:hypothetical protein
MKILQTNPFYKMKAAESVKHVFCVIHIPVAAVK